MTYRFPDRNRDVEIIERDTGWLFRRRRHFALYHGVLCCNGHRDRDHAIEHARTLFRSERWA